MNRRTVLRAAGASIPVAVAGCLGSIQELELSTPVPIRVINETDVPRNVQVVAMAADDGRETYDESVNVQPDQRADLGHLDTEEQRVRVTLFDDDVEPAVTEEADVGTDTQSLRVYVVGADALEIEVNRRE